MSPWLNFSDRDMGFAPHRTPKATLPAGDTVMTVAPAAWDPRAPGRVPRAAVPGPARPQPPTQRRARPGGRRPCASVRAEGPHFAPMNISSRTSFHVVPEPRRR